MAESGEDLVWAEMERSIDLARVKGNREKASAKAEKRSSVCVLALEENGKGHKRKLPGSPESLSRASAKWNENSASF